MLMDFPAERRVGRIRSFVAMLVTASVVMVSAVFLSPAAAAPPVSSTGTPFTGVEVEATGSDILAAGVGTVVVARFAQPPRVSASKTSRTTIFFIPMT